MSCVRLAPPHAQRVRTVFDDGDSALVADFLHLVQLRHASAHVREHEELCASLVGLQCQVVHVDNNVARALHKAEHSACMVDGRRDRSEGERVAEYLRALRHARGPEGQEEGRAAGIQRDAILEAHVVGQLLLHQRHGRLRIFAVVAEQVARLQQAHDVLLLLPVNRLWCIEALLDARVRAVWEARLRGLKEPTEAGYERHRARLL
mmetsp:Transcript_28923/g.77210  ORF Transcript_28923/g.77210 Transcript_28923/m.77210 type:complete len:206 (+) Transcript_28923:1225-1842(+)